MKFAKYTYLIAGIYGIFVLLPLYFLKDYVGQENPPLLTHPEFFYGFVGVALAWQFVFLIISHEPLKYRALMLISILEKAAWGIPVLILYLQNKVLVSMLAAGISDLIWGALFIVSYLKINSSVKDTEIRETSEK
jgi:hypothetical protein